MANLRNPVRFDAAMQALLNEPAPTLFIEISPHPLLVPAIEDGIEERAADSAAVPSMLREQPAGESLLTSLAVAYVRGCEPDWARVNNGGRFVPLPTYPWQRERFWITPAAEVVEPARPAVVAALPVESVPTEPTRPALVHAEPTRPVPVPTEPSRPGPIHTVIRSVAALTEHLVRRAAEILAAAPESVNPALPLTVCGMDSLLAAKLRTRLKQDLDLHVPIGELLGDRPLTELATHLHNRVANRPGRHQFAEVLAS